MNFVLEKQLIKLSCTYHPLSICKVFIKKILELVQSYVDVHHFWDQNSPFALNNFFLGINHCYYFHLPMAFFRIITMHHFWAQSGPFTSNNIFSENLLMSLVYFIHAYLHAENQSQILIY